MSPQARHAASLRACSLITLLWRGRHHDPHGTRERIHHHVRVLRMLQGRQR